MSKPFDVLAPAQLSALVASAADRQDLELLALGAGLGTDAIAAAAKLELAECAVAWATAEPAGEAELVRLLDDSCARERSLIASIAAVEVRAEVGGHEALHVRRHGAKLVWALLRDERSEVRGDARVLALAYLADHGAGERVGEEGAQSDVGPRADNKVRRLEKRVAALERERDELSTHKSRADELAQEAERLRTRLDELREQMARERRQRPAAESPRAPAVESPRAHLAHKRKAGSGARLGLFVDVANLAGAARRTSERPVDFHQLKKVVLGGRQLVEARAYAIDKGQGGFEGFARALKAAGYRVLAKKPKVFADGTMKADWDVGITVDALCASDELDVVVLASGDGDFAPLVLALKQRGVRVEVASFAERTAPELVRAADAHYELDASMLV